ncbi:hypothetical protein EVAR_21504_1 [Eumeta japonica]|uniref:Uncharacterized protein n=1 Tax=Eumeta variegata TaxID=151549 RepID=A0A4C1UZK1_EUMVA|nr:hypothetical protein EVAR_21504_1 [Eumeta japonica]
MYFTSYLLNIIAERMFHKHIVGNIRWTTRFDIAATARRSRRSHVTRYRTDRTIAQETRLIKARLRNGDAPQQMPRIDLGLRHAALEDAGRNVAMFILNYRRYSYDFNAGFEWKKVKTSIL